MEFPFLITQICKFSSTTSAIMSCISCSVYVVGSQSKTKIAVSHLRREGVLVTLNISPRQRKVFVFSQNDSMSNFYMCLSFYNLKTLNNTLEAIDINQCTMISYNC